MEIAIVILLFTILIGIVTLMFLQYWYFVIIRKDMSEYFKAYCEINEATYKNILDMIVESYNKNK